MAKKNVYFFGGGKADGKSTMKNLLGGKGANLAEMASLGVPVPAGFTVTTEVCSTYYENKRRLSKALVDEMKRTHNLRIRKWRSSSSGCAWIVRYDDGRERNLIEAPYPKGPMSCAIFLHEVGHHAIGFGTYKPRCLEEYHAWQWALQTMRAKGLNVTAAVEKRMAESLRYAVQKAKRRGLKEVPEQLAAYV